MQCRRALWYAAMGHEQVVKPDADTLMMWDTGNILETVVVRAMRRDGWKVNRRHNYLEFIIMPGIYVTGHPDGICRLEKTDKPFHPRNQDA